MLTMLVPFAVDGGLDGAGGKGLKLEVPAQSVNPGEPVYVYLWGRTIEALDGWILFQAANALGAGQLAEYPGQTEVAFFDLAGDGLTQDFDWPVAALASVTAWGPLYRVDGQAVTLAAPAGADVTGQFRLVGNGLAPAAGGSALLGTVRAVAARSPHCRVWRWIVPAAVNAGVPDWLCPDASEERPVSLFWFFLSRWEIMQEDFSMQLDLVGVPGRLPVFHFDAKDLTASAGDLIDYASDKYGTALSFEPDRPNGYDDGQSAASVTYVDEEYPALRFAASIAKNPDISTRYSVSASMIAEFAAQCSMGKTLFVVSRSTDPMPGVLHSSQYRSGVSAKVWFSAATDLTAGSVCADTDAGGQLGNGPSYNNEGLHDSFAHVRGDDFQYLGFGGQALFGQRALTTLTMDASQRLTTVRRNGVHLFDFVLGSDNWGDVPVPFSLNALRIAVAANYVSAYTPVGQAYAASMDIHEIIVFDTVFSDEERLAREQAIMAAWGIA